MTDSAEKALKNAYSLLKNVTPLDGMDCGEICGALCCSGSDNDGMFLFPYEEELLKTEKFRICSAETNYGFNAVVCGGTCSRCSRPLACRIFPLFPTVESVDGHDRFGVIADPRASVCPLLSGEIKLSKKFIRNVRRAGRFLARDPEINGYLKKMTTELYEIAELKSRFENR